jgi:acyl-CoA synthetase (AMP-forming)/AMP-acid ligase II
MNTLNTDFTLIEGGQMLSVEGVNAVSLVDVAKDGVRGVIAALLGTGDVFIVRDASVPVPQVAEDKVWLQTSGTTGVPKWVGHSRDSLMARIKVGGDKARWLLTFHPGSFAGLQVILTAMAGGHVLIAPDHGASIAGMADLAVAERATYISGTPTFWRAFLMTLGDRSLTLKSVTLGGEAADQTLLDALKARFPQVTLRHIYATTEAGTVFSVQDGLAGFPRDWLNNDLSITGEDTLKVKGLDTGDIVEVTEDRVLFKGRRDAMVNVGGVKVYPETVETYLLQLPFIQDVRVSPRPNPITGHVVVADIVLKANSDFDEAQIKAHLQSLPRAQRPVSLRYVEALDIGATGKKSRSL